MVGVTELGYLGLSVSDLDAWKSFACGVGGMEYVDEGEGDRAYLRMDKWHHRITLHADGGDDLAYLGRSEEHTSELQSLMRISYAVFCLKKKKINHKKIE